MAYDKKYSKKCLFCNKVFYKNVNTGMPEWRGNKRRPKGVRFCSRVCTNLYLKETHIPWNKGRTDLPPHTDEHKEKISKGWEVKREAKTHTTWSGSRWSNTKKRVLIRDNYTCKECGFKEDEIMQADHIIPKSIRPDLYYKMANCQTLCPNCHARKTIIDRASIRLHKKEN